MLKDICSNKFFIYAYILASSYFTSLKTIDIANWKNEFWKNIWREIWIWVYKGMDKRKAIWDSVLENPIWLPLGGGCMEGCMIICVCLSLFCSSSIAFVFLSSFALR